MQISLFIKVTYWIQILMNFFKILYYVSYKVTFSISKVNFWFFIFIATKSLNVDSFTNGI